MGAVGRHPVTGTRAADAVRSGTGPSPSATLTMRSRAAPRSGQRLTRATWVCREVDHTRGIEAGHWPVRIATRIADHARATQLDIGDSVRVTKNPERDAIGTHQRGEAARERSGERAQVRQWWLRSD